MLKKGSAIQTRAVYVVRYLARLLVLHKRSLIKTSYNCQVVKGGILHTISGV